MFLSIEELVDQAKAYPSVAELMIAVEMEMSGRSRSHIIEIMEKNLSVMEQSINEGKEGVTSVTGITGGDAKKLDDYLNEADFLSGETILKAVRNAVAVNEVNAKMGLICATPTAGSAGVVPGVLMAVRDRLDLTHEQQLEFLFTAGAFGLVIANNASISGAEGGCQAFISADMALAGIESVIPPDEVVAAMYQVGRQMPSIFKETAEGGLAVTPTAKRLAEEILNKRA